ncbi:hypothetical protein BGZ92_009199 [Podila epicladia]|nr:hypothetical protein BGZ92_009199 [Podila epicladia]
MRFSPVIAFVLVTLASWTLICHTAPAGDLPHQAHDLIESISPREGDEYHVGDTIRAQVRVIDDELDDTQIKLTFQRAILRPDVNIHIANVSLSELSDDGYEFDVTIL